MYPQDVSTSNSEKAVFMQTHVCMVATLQTYICSHSGYWPLYGQVLVCILSSYLEPYQCLARPDILPLSLSVSSSLIHRHLMLW